MTIQHHLITLARRFHRRPCESLRAISTSVATTPITCNSSPYSTLTDYIRIHCAPVTQVTTLPNGLRVATESNLSSETATVGVWVETESPMDGTGILFMNVLVPDRRFEEIKNMGGNFNVWSKRGFTEYYAEDVVEKDIPQALDILSDIFQNFKLRKKRIESERYRTLTYQKKKEEEPHEAIYRHLFNTNPNLLGYAENIKTVTKKDLLNYMSTYYTTPRMVIVAVGAVKHEEIVEQVKSKFTKLSQGSTTTSELATKDRTIRTASELRILDDDIPLAHFMVAFNGASWGDPDYATLMVLEEMLGGYGKSLDSEKSMSSALLERQGISELAETMWAFYYPEESLFGVRAKAKPDCLDVLAQSIMYEVTRLCYKVSEDDVVRARNQLKYSLLLYMDDNSRIAKDIVLQLLTCGRRIPYAELFAKIADVDASTVKRVASRFIFDKDIRIVAIGPVQGLPSYDWFRRCGGSKTSIHPRLKYSVKTYRNKC